MACFSYVAEHGEIVEVGPLRRLAQVQQHELHAEWAGHPIRARIDAAERSQQAAAHGPQDERPHPALHPVDTVPPLRSPRRSRPRRRRTGPPSPARGRPWRRSTWGARTNPRRADPGATRDAEGPPPRWDARELRGGGCPRTRATWRAYSSSLWERSAKPTLVVTRGRSD